MIQILCKMKRPMLKRKTRKWPNMFGQKRVYKPIPLTDCITCEGECVHCVSEPICINF